MVNGENFLSHVVSLTLVQPCPISNLFEILSYSMLCPNFMIVGYSILEISCSKTDRQLDRQTDMSKYSIVVMKTLQFKNNKILIFYQNFHYNHPRKKKFFILGHLRSKVTVPNESPIMTSYLMLILYACVSGTVLKILAIQQIACYLIYLITIA